MPYTLCLCSMYIHVRQNLDSWFDTHKKPRYQPVTNFSYWPVLGSIKYWNIIALSNKATKSEAFEGIHKFVFDDISENMDSLVQYGKYGTINTTDKPKMVNYAINLSWRHTIYKMTLHGAEI